MIPALQAALNDAAAEISAVKREVTLADIAELNATRSQIFTATRALAYVRASAVLERFTRSALGAVIGDIEARAVAKGRLCFGLHAVRQAPVFDRARDVSGLRMWRARLELLQDIDDVGPSTFGGITEFALDGRTLRSDHFDTIWLIFGFTLPSLPGALHRLALHDLAETRNDVAHGRRTPAAVARAKPTPEVLRMLGLVEDILEHVTLAADAYLATAGFRR